MDETLSKGKAPREDRVNETNRAPKLSTPGVIMHLYLPACIIRRPLDAPRSAACVLTRGGPPHDPETWLTSPYSGVSKQSVSANRWGREGPGTSVMTPHYVRSSSWPKANRILAPYIPPSEHRGVLCIIRKGGFRGCVEKSGTIQLDRSVGFLSNSILINGRMRCRYEKANRPLVLALDQT